MNEFYPPTNSDQLPDPEFEFSLLMPSGVDQPNDAAKYSRVRFVHDEIDVALTYDLSAEDVR
jgi:hypothetical protein